MKVIQNLQPLPASLSESHLADFEHQGYVAFANVLSADEVRDVKRSMKQFCIDMVRGAQTGRCTIRHEPRGNTEICIVEQRGSSVGVQFESGVDIGRLTEEQLAQSYRKLISYIDTTDAFRRVKTHSRLAKVRRQLLGPDSILFQDMALSKPAKIGTEKPWHQDNAYFKFAPLEEILGIWIALDDATVANGCMHVIPIPRDQRFAFQHTHDVDCDMDVKDLDLAQAEAVEIPAGGAMFFSGMLPHHTPANRSAQRRRALQLHYRGAHTVPLDEDAYDRVFRTRDGLPATCQTR